MLDDEDLKASMTMNEISKRDRKTSKGSGGEEASKSTPVEKGEDLTSANMRESATE
jgi:hypothetical protein